MAGGSDRELSFPEYWDQRYDKPGATNVDHEWFRGFAQLQPFLLKHCPDANSNPTILHLGCGTSEITRELYNLGYRSQVNIDFAPKAIEVMQRTNGDLKEVQWHVMDVRNMELQDASFDIAFDKGTLDAMLHGSLWNLEDEVRQNTNAYINEVVRILKPGGLWLYVTYRQPHFIRPMLKRVDWDIDVETLGGEDGTFEYFGWVLKKKSKDI